MSSKKRFNSDLRRLDYRPDMSPFVQGVTVPVRKSRVRSGLSERPLIDGESGELVATSVIHQIQETDTDQFVKVFSAGIAAAYELSRTGQRVFQAVLHEYEKTPMHGGYADEVYLVWFDGGLDGRALDMSEYTFNRGMRELLDKSFIAPRSPGRFWVNPSLFFKGDRVMFVKEYRRNARCSVERTPDVLAGDSPRDPAQPDKAPVQRAIAQGKAQHPADSPVALATIFPALASKKKVSRR